MKTSKYLHLRRGGDRRCQHKIRKPMRPWVYSSYILINCDILELLQRPHRLVVVMGYNPDEGSKVSAWISFLLLSTSCNLFTFERFLSGHLGFHTELSVRGQFRLCESLLRNNGKVSYQTINHSPLPNHLLPLFQNEPAQNLSNENEFEGESHALSYEWFRTQWFLVLTQGQRGTRSWSIYYPR